MTRHRRHDSNMPKSLASWLLRLFFVIPGCLPLMLLADDAKKEDVPPPANKAPAEADVRRFRNMLENLKNGGRRNNPREGGSTERENLDSSRDLLENRAPRDPKLEQMLKMADDAATQKNVKLALDLYQRLLDLPEETLHRLPNGQWQGIRRTVNQRIGRLPESEIGEYRSRLGGLARQKLQAALRSGQTTELANVATRFFHTTAGYEAAHLLAMRYFDRSEFGMAARWFSDLAASPAEIVRQDLWLLQAAIALSRSNDREGAIALLNRLSQGPTTPVTLGTETATASQWLDQLQNTSSLPAMVLTDWTQMYGTASRTGVTAGGDPLLAPNWSLQLTSSPNIRDQIKWITSDLLDQQRALILAAQPLVIHGRVIYRDLRGLRSVNIETGETLWEGVEGVSAERILGGLPSQQFDPQDALRLQVNQNANLGDYPGQSAEYSPLTSLLFRDGIYGLISSDGNQIFAIEENGILSSRQGGNERWGWDGNTEPQDFFGVSWKTNRLVSYDLETGRVLWSLGGSDLRESFDPPLAGSYFYGTPVIDDEELFVVAGKGEEIRLWSLDRRTGKPNWSQRIAYSDTKIEIDLVRRCNSSQVAVGGGVIVCPTTVGWLVAVDRVQQSVLWAHRYAPPATANNVGREAGTLLLPQRQLDAQWCPSAPVISGNRVVFTPQDEPLVICLNLTDGRRIWDKPKETGCYLAGVYDQKVIIAGESNVKALRLADGEIAWETKFDDAIRISGRGVVANDRFYLPRNNGELLSIGLEAGKVLKQSYVASQQPPLGNLAMHDGKFVSLGPAGLFVYSQRDAIAAEIDQRLKTDPSDVTGLLRLSVIELLNRNYSETIRLLKQITIDRLSPVERVQMHSAYVESLSKLIQNDVLQRADELDELGRMAETTAERQLHRELTAEKLLAERKPAEAFEIFCKLAEEETGGFVVRTDDRHISTSRSVWLSGRMSEIWSVSSDPDRQLIDGRIQTILQNTETLDIDVCRRYLNLFRFHPESIRAQEQFIERLIQMDDLGGARTLLQQLFENADKRVAGWATERLARLMMESRLPFDAVHYYELLETEFAEVVIRDGLTGAVLAAQARTTHLPDFSHKTTGLSWKPRPLRMALSSINYTPAPQEVVYDSDLPFFNRISLDCFHVEQRLSLESAETGQVEWLIPLRNGGRNNEESYFSTSLIGHQLFFVNRGILHAVSPIEKRILWTKSLEDRIEGNVPMRHDGRPHLTAMTPTHQGGTSPSLWLQNAFFHGPLAITQSNYLCLQGRRTLVVLDPCTGDELWKLEGLAINAQVIGNRNIVFVVNPGTNQMRAYRATDGAPLEIPDLAKLLNHAMLMRGSSLLLFEPNRSTTAGAQITRRGRATTCSLRMYDPVMQTTQWQQEFPAGTVVTTLGQSEVVAFQPDSRVRRINVDTGKVAILDSPTTAPLAPKKVGQPPEAYALADADRIYLVVNRMDGEPPSFAESLASIRVNGWIYAWNRQDNRFLWEQEVKDQNLIVDRFSKSPVLLFVSRTWRQRRRTSMNIGSLVVGAIDKQTGKKLIDEKLPAAYSAFHSLNINFEDRSIDLKSYNIRLRLLATDDSAVPPPPADSLNRTAP